MTIKVGINGFGRIGRMAFRAIAKDFPSIEVVGINDLLEPDYLAYMLKYDSVHGRFNGDVAVDGNTMIVNGKTIRLTAERDPANLKWDEIGAELVIECTGFFLDEASCQKHIAGGCQEGGAERPFQGCHPHVRLWRQSQDLCRPGHHLGRFLHHQLPGPVAKVLNDNWGIKRGLMTTVHAATATQKTVDGPSMKDWRGGRGILENIIPSSTGAAKAVGVVLPELNKKLTGMAFRVPTSDVSVVDLTVELNKEAAYADICAAMKAASQGALKACWATPTRRWSPPTSSATVHAFHLRRRGRHRPGRHLRQGRGLVRQRVRLHLQHAASGRARRQVRRRSTGRRAA
jgi:glyceraldehyde 3-phosphate dehydrogenase